MKTLHYGKLGVAAGFVALVIAVLHFWLGPFHTPEPTLKEVVASKAAEIKQSFSAALKGKSRPASKAKASLNLDKMITTIGITLAVLTFILAAVSFLKKEDYRYGAAGVVLGGATLAFYFVLVAIGLVILLVAMAIVMGNLN